MLRRITLKNVLKHEDLTVELSPGVNALVGESDAGKSSIFDLFEWIRKNRPLGDGLISWWSDWGEGDVETDDGHVLTRRKGPNENVYELDGRTFEAFGASVPEEISKALNMTDLNVQTQDERHYLLPPTYSPGQVAQIVNELVGLDDIDRSRSWFKSHLSSLEADKKAVKADLDRLKEELESFEDLDRMEAEVRLAEQVERQLRADEARLAALLGARDRIANLRSEVAEHDKVLANGDGVKRQLKELADLETEEDRLRSLSALRDRANALRLRQAKAETVIANSDLVERLRSDLEGLEADEDRLEELELARSGIDLLRAKVEREDGKLKDLEKRFHELMPEVCPLCGK